MRKRISKPGDRYVTAGRNCKTESLVFNMIQHPFKWDLVEVITRRTKTQLHRFMWFHRSCGRVVKYLHPLKFRKLADRIANVRQ